MIVPYSLGRNQRMDLDSCQISTTNYPNGRHEQSVTLGATNDKLIYCAPRDSKNHCWSYSLKSNQWDFHSDIFNGYYRHNSGFAWVPFKQRFIFIGGRLHAGDEDTRVTHLLNPDDMTVTTGPELTDTIDETCAIQINSTHTLYAGGWNLYFITLRLKVEFSTL